ALRTESMASWRESNCVLTVLTSAIEDKKQSPHLPINRDDIDDDGWRKPILISWWGWKIDGEPAPTIDYRRCGGFINILVGMEN
ncbi:MAG: hypothetical protein ABWU14_18125, partial [Limnospira maxima]